MRPMFREGVRLLATTMLAAGFGGSAYADDWLQWRGPDRAGISTETGLLDEWPPEGPAVNWQIETLGQGYGTVAVEGDAIYVQGTRDGESAVFRLRASDGGEVWMRKLGPLYDHPDRGDGPRSVPTVHGDSLFVLNGMGEVAKIAKDTGEVIWQFNMLDRFRSPNTHWGISESPLVVRDRVFVMPGGREGAIAALSAADGSTIWRSSELGDVASYSSLILRRIEGTEVLLGFTGEAGVGVRADNGGLLWRYERPSTVNAINITTPVLEGNLVFYTASYGIGGGALAITAEDEGGSFHSEEAYFGTRLQNHHGGVIAHEGTLYSFFGPALTAVDARTGEVHWRARSVGKGSLVMADGKLFLLSEHHKVGLAVATPEGYQERGRFEIEDRGGPSWAHPVVANGAFYIRDQESLTSYDVAK
ncbi:MAG: PQQ-like beta-propeller repeat protein [Acidobacteria bacterium]|nr:PQQ-like beta-propeller repeat protein [Acidobacteriota bacterium]